MREKEKGSGRYIYREREIKEGQRAGQKNKMYVMYFTIIIVFTLVRASGRVVSCIKSKYLILVQSPMAFVIINLYTNIT